MQDVTYIRRNKSKALLLTMVTPSLRCISLAVSLRKPLRYNQFCHEKSLKNTRKKHSLSPSRMKLSTSIFSQNC